MISPRTRPKLRPLEIKHLQHEGRWYFHLRDQLSLSEEQLLVPYELGPALALFDGEHDLAMIRAGALLTAGLDLSPADVVQLVERLDGALLLEGERLERAMAEALAAYHAAPHRPLALADRVYPAEPEALSSLLLAYEMQATSAIAQAEDVAGVLTPHIDYARGGPVYAQVWRQAGAAARAAESAIILGTDHAGGPGRLTLSRQRYATPWGAVDGWADLRSSLEAVLGQEACYAEELHHRSEHSVELALVWLQHARGGRPLRVLPVLCGYPGPFMGTRANGDGAPAGCGFPGPEQPLGQAIALLREAVAGGALVVVAGDLAHVGPAFGDRVRFAERERALVRAADSALLDACSRGSRAVLNEVGAIEDRYRICGLAPLALALEIMPPVRLELAAYDQCPADAEDASFVSVAGGCFVRAHE